MGVAAYNRGTKCIRKQLQDKENELLFRFMDELNTLEKYPDAGTPFSSVNLDQSHGGWWIYCPKTDFGYWYKTLREAVKRWKITITGYKNGEWEAIPLQK